MDESSTGPNITQMLDELYDGQLLNELSYRIDHARQRKRDEPSAGGKPKSKPPLDITAMELYDRATQIIGCLSINNEDEFRKIYREIRQFLGYEPRMVELTKVCGLCTSKLIVAEDASTDVFCTNPECEVVYRQEDWIALLYVESDCT